MAHHLPAAKLTAVEIDEAPCEAATKHMGLDATRCTIVCADGLEWVEALGDDDEMFDAVFVDIFDERNLCPQGFYSDSFLQKLSKQMADDAVVVHNLHAGSKTLDAEIEVAEAAYERVFGAVEGAPRSIASRGRAMRSSARRVQEACGRRRHCSRRRMRRRAGLELALIWRDD